MRNPDDFPAWQIAVVLIKTGEYQEIPYIPPYPNADASTLVLIAYSFHYCIYYS
jgi:hypothetical protein